MLRFLLITFRDMKTVLFILAKMERIILRVLEEDAISFKLHSALIKRILLWDLRQQLFHPVLTMAIMLLLLFIEVNPIILLMGTSPTLCILRGNSKYDGLLNVNRQSAERPFPQYRRERPLFSVSIGCVVSAALRFGVPRFGVPRFGVPRFGGFEIIGG